ncbi:hypothetical protein [Amnibacterium kyonggiense]
MVDLEVSVALVVVVLVVGLRARRRTRGSRTGSAVPVVAVVVAILPVIARLVGASATADDVLGLAPIGAYVLFGVYWLLRNHRDVVAGWKAETEDDRRRGLR